MSNQLGDLLDELDFETWLDHEGIRHKLTRGTRGVQANIRECPSCGNTKWKVYFGLESNLGNCFVCDTKFTKWRFITAHLNVANADVARYVENYMRTQGWRPRQVRSNPVTVSELELPKSIVLPTPEGRNMSYLTNRNITKELTSYFHLRYCHEGVHQYQDAYGRLGYQDYSRRIIIPIFDMDGKMVSFQGRDITGTAEKKYLFPPGFAATGSVLYNGQNARKATRVVAGEGVFDCIAIKAALDEDKVLRNCVPLASFGKKLGPDQMTKLKALAAEGLKEVIFMWDAEKEALEAAVEASLECRANGLSAKIALLPKGRDPNEVAPEVVRQAVWDARVVDPQSAIKLLLLAKKL